MEMSMENQTRMGLIWKGVEVKQFTKLGKIEMTKSNNSNLLLHPFIAKLLI